MKKKSNERKKMFADDVLRTIDTSSIQAGMTITHFDAINLNPGTELL